MEHVAVAALALAILLLVAREARLRRYVQELERRAARAEADAGAERQLAVVGELISRLASELKTPLQGVLGNSEVMLASDAERQTEELRDIHEHAARAADIVRNLVAFSEATSLTRRWDDLNEVCRRAIEAARPQVASSVAIEANLGPRLPLVYVDGRQLEKAIAALLGHAGTVRATWRADAVPPGPQPIVVSTHEAAGDMLVVDIEFPSLTQDAVEHALAAGELDACRQVIRAHGGRVTVAGRRAGAGVAIEVPAAVVDVEPSSSPSPRATALQEPSSPWTTSSTTSTSTASGTSRS